MKSKNLRCPYLWLFALVLAILQTTKTHAQQPSFLTNGLVAYYPFNGNANDASGNGNNPSFQNGTPIPDRYGNAGSAMSMGVNHYIEIPHTTNIVLTHALTLTAWIRLATYDGVDSKHQESIISTVDWTGWNGGLEFNIYGTGTNSDYGRLGVSGGFSESNGGGIQGHGGAMTELISGTNIWMHVAIVYDNEVKSLWLDGNQRASIYSDAKGVVENSNNPIRIGRRSGAPPNDNWFLGDIDDVRIYNRALNNDEIIALYEYESTPPDRSFINYGLVAYYPLNGDAKDASGKGNDGTVTGAALTNDRFGKTGGAFRFSGATSEQILITNTLVNIDQSQNEYTLRVWFNSYTTNNKAGGVLLNSYPNPDYFGLSWSAYDPNTYVGSLIGGGSSWDLQLDGNNAVPLAFSQVLPNVWYCGTLTKSGQIYSLYVNDKLQFIGTNNAAASYTGLSGLIIGSDKRKRPVYQSLATGFDRRPDDRKSGAWWM